jgi:nitrate reductase molybdenum cofactor assembly chaperone
MPVALAKEASRLFEYPRDDYRAALRRVVSRCRADLPAAAVALGHFESRLGEMALCDLRDLYTRTFDLTPACAPYLSIHLFGEESFKRARLMTGLRESYQSKGFDCAPELPDHIAVVLSALERLDDEVRRDLLALCFKVALSKMRTELERQDNPFAHAVAGLEHCVEHWLNDAEAPHA